MKSIIRNEILSRLKSISPEDKAQASARVQNNLTQTLKNETGVWVAYRHLKDEPEIKWHEVSAKIEWAFPMIENEGLSFRHLPENFVMSALGFLEPHDGTAVELSQINGFVIPALSYDAKGHRLGRGKGYYDRALAQFKGKKIGVCFDVSFCEELPHEPHDVICDQIVTEKQIFKVVESEGVRKWN